MNLITIRNKSVPCIDDIMIIASLEEGMQKNLSSILTSRVWLINTAELYGSPRVLNFEELPGETREIPQTVGNK